MGAQRKVNPGLDLRDLDELINIREALYELAEYSWRQENKKKPQDDFKKNIEIRIFGFEGGSCDSSFQIRNEPRRKTKKTHVQVTLDGLLEDADAKNTPRYHVRNAARLLTAKWKSAKNESATDGLPSNIEDKIAKIGATRVSKEAFSMEVMPDKPSAVELLTQLVPPEEPLRVYVTAEERVACVARLSGQSNEPRRTADQPDVTIDGEVTEVNRIARSANVRIGGALSGEKPIQVKMETDLQVDVSIEALKRNSGLWVRVTGVAEVDLASNKITKIKTATTVSHIDERRPYTQSTIDSIDSTPQQGIVVESIKYDHGSLQTEPIDATDSPANGERAIAGDGASMGLQTAESSGGWVYEMYRLCRDHQTDDALYVAINNVDSLLFDGKFDDCDRILSDLDPSKLDPETMIGLLNITALASDKLVKRNEFWSRVHDTLLKTEDSARVEKILGRLK
ncbi:MAG: hypothetical protein ABI193_14815 [Minicystis sp.]